MIAAGHPGRSTLKACSVLSMLIVSLLMISACGGSAETARAPAGGEFPMTVDTCGREVTIDKPPERVMTVGAEAPTLMWAAGAADKIKVLAATFGAVYGAAEPAFKNAPLISTDDEPSREVIIGHMPDLLLGYGLETQRPPTWKRSASTS